MLWKVHPTQTLAWGSIFPHPQNKFGLMPMPAMTTHAWKLEPIWNTRYDNDAAVCFFYHVLHNVGVSSFFVPENTPYPVI